MPAATLLTSPNLGDRLTLGDRRNSFWIGTLKLFLNQDIYVDDDDLNESNPNMMLIRRNSEADDDDNLGEMIGFPRVPLLPDHGKLSSYLQTSPW